MPDPSPSPVLAEPIAPPREAAAPQSTISHQPSTWAAVRGSWSVVRSLLSRSPWSAFLPLALFSVLWLDLIRQLSYQWSANEQYAYGWFVPLLAAGLFWKRWADRPEAEPAHPPIWVIVSLGLLALLWLPMRVVHEINQDWPLISWPLALLAVAFTLFALFLAGGMRWVRHFAFPSLFILVAVQWPYRIEHGLTQGLMQAVVAITVKVLTRFDVVALQRGNIIELSTGVVGIDEACAGIRSFQSTLMGALFLGELYRFTTAKRIQLILGGVGLSFCLNIVRTFFLTWYASSAGIDIIKKLHDPAGFSIFILSFACLWWMAWRIRKRAAAQALAEEAEYGKFIEHTDVEPPRAASGGFDSLLTHGFLRRFLVMVGSWCLVAFVFTEVWYRAHDTGKSAFFHWTASPPEIGSKPALELPSSAVRMLAYDEAVTGEWQEQDGADFSLFFFRWNPMSAQSAMRARSHRPEACLPAAGFRLVSESKLIHFQTAKLQLPFRKYVYDAQGTKFYVFFCLWEDGAENQPGMGRSQQADRIESVLNGRRWLGQQTLEIVITGCDSADTAERKLREQLPGIIRMESSD